MLLTGKIAVVTGASSREGIGFASARIFIEHGAKVAIVGIDDDALASVTQNLGEAALPIVADVSQTDACRSVVERVLANWGRIDVLVNNAGVVQTRKMDAISRADYDRIMDVNLWGTLLMSQSVLPHMVAGGSIINIASIAAQRGGGLMGGPHYAASKGGVLALTKSIAREFGPAGIRANAINPGVIMTGMTADNYDDGLREKVVSSIPLGRMGVPSDVAAACLFLASSLSSYITGASIDVNGGMHIH